VPTFTYLRSSFLPTMYACMRNSWCKLLRCAEFMFPPPHPSLKELGPQGGVSHDENEGQLKKGGLFQRSYEHHVSPPPIRFFLEGFQPPLRRFRFDILWRPVRRARRVPPEAVLRILLPNQRAL